MMQVNVIAADKDTQELSLRGRRVVYRASGNAGSNAVVLLHGIPTSSYLWRNVVPSLGALLPSWRVVAPDLPGYGGSEPGRSAGPVAGARFCAEFTRELGLERVVLVGHDFGGLAALYAALRPTERGFELGPQVVGLVLSDTTIFPTIPLIAGLLPTMVPGLSDIALAWLGRGGRRARADRRQRFLRALRALLTVGTHLTVEDEIAYAEPFATRGGWRQVQRDLRGVALDAPRLGFAVTRLSRVQVPVGLVWGERDPIFPLATARRLQRTLPGDVPLDVIAGAGHFVPEECPREVAAAIGAFVRRVGD